MAGRGGGAGALSSLDELMELGFRPAAWAGIQRRVLKFGELSAGSLVDVCSDA